MSIRKSYKSEHGKTYNQWEVLEIILREPLKIAEIKYGLFENAGDAALLKTPYDKKTIVLRGDQYDRLALSTSMTKVTAEVKINQDEFFKEL